MKWWLTIIVARHNFDEKHLIIIAFNGSKVNYSADIIERFNFVINQTGYNQLGCINKSDFEDLELIGD